jgi:fructose-1,6-bisphosphatase I
MGMIVTEAGGACSTGKQNNLEILPTGVDNRIPIYVGGRSEIQLIENYLKG